MRFLVNKSADMPARPKPVAAKRLPVLADYLKAEDNNFALVRLLMALAVLVSHSWWLATGRTSEEPLHIWTNHSLGEHAVQVFFFLSGVVVAQSLFRSKSILDFACARALRIFPALIACVLVTALLLGPAVSVLGLKSYFGDAGLIAYIVKTLSLSTGSAPLPGVFPDNPVPRLVNLSLWTLKYEVLCYVLLGAFGMLFLTWPKLRPYLTGALVLIIALIFVGEPKPASSYTQLDNVRYFILFFGMGTLAYLFRERLVLTWLVLPLLALAFVFAIGTRYAELTSAIFLGYGTLLFAKLPLPRLRWFTNDQDYSYAVYIFHCPIQQALVQFKPDIDPIELTLVTLALVLPLSVFSWTHVERPAMNTRRALVGWLRSLWPAKAAKPVFEAEAAAAQPSLLKQRVKSLARGRGSAVAPLDFGQLAAATVSTREDSTMPRDKATTITSQPEAAPVPAVAARTVAPSVSRSKIAEWFSRKRKAEQDPIVASISEQFSARIKAAARQAGVDAERLAQQTVTSSADKAPLFSETAANSANPRKASRTRRLARMSKTAPAEAGVTERSVPPQAQDVPAAPRTRPPRLSNAAPTKLWARPSRMVVASEAEAKTAVQGRTVRIAETTKAADLLFGMTRTTARGAKPAIEVAEVTRAVAAEPSAAMAPAAPKRSVTEATPAPAAQEAQVTATTRTAQPNLQSRVAAGRSQVLRERLNQLMTRRNESIHKRLAKQRTTPIPLA